MDYTVLWSGDGVLVIGIAAVLPRAEARLLLRAAVCEAAAQWLQALPLANGQKGL